MDGWLDGWKKCDGAYTMYVYIGVNNRYIYIYINAKRLIYDLLVPSIQHVNFDTCLGKSRPLGAIIHIMRL